MRIEDYQMPSAVEGDSEAQQVLKIYAQIRPEVDISDPDACERLLEDSGGGQRIFIACDSYDE